MLVSNAPTTPYQYDTLNNIAASAGYPDYGPCPTNTAIRGIGDM